jgi:hypothetical protein
MAPTLFSVEQLVFAQTLKVRALPTVGGPAAAAGCGTAEAAVDADRGATG